jgi:hypothetical protein
MLEHADTDKINVLPIDQLEELFQSKQNVIDEFLHLIFEALGKNPRLVVICTIRSDSYPLLQKQTAFSLVGRTLFDLPVIPEFRWSEIIKKPATLAGNEHVFSDKIVERIIEDHKGAVALPLLSYSLKQFYIASLNPELEVEAYVPGRGIHGVIDRQVDRAMVSLGGASWEDRTEADTAVADLFIPWLVTTDPSTGQPRRHIARRRDMSGGDSDLARVLVNERLLITSLADGDTTLEVAHEAIFEAWSPLRRALKKSLADVHFARQFLADVQDWKADSFNIRHLTYQGTSLARILDLLQKFPALVRNWEELSISYLWLCVRRDFSQTKRWKYFLLLAWLLLVLASLRLR